MRKLGWLALVLLMISSCSTLNSGKSMDSFGTSDCSGALPLLIPGKTLGKMPGSGGQYNEFKSYPVIEDLEEINSRWFSFAAEYNGTFYFSAEVPAGDEEELGMLIFEKEPGRDICLDIQSGRAEVLRFMIDKGFQSVGLDKSRSRNRLYPIHLNEGQEIYIIVYSNSINEHSIITDFKFESDGKIDKHSGQKIVDRRKQGEQGNYRILVRDADTENPVIATITLEGIENIEGSYTASDLYVQPNRTGKLSIHCGAKGYFLVDREENVRFPANDEITVNIERLSPGKSMQISDIQFKPNTSEFLPGAEANLKRLKDFMLLNDDVKIEIQGHVMETGGNSVLGQKMSEARAKRVMKYLLDAGVSKRRMTAVGYGSTRPVYPDPKHSAEEQANRRVEVLIL